MSCSIGRCDNCLATCKADEVKRLIAERDEARAGINQSESWRLAYVEAENQLAVLRQRLKTGAAPATTSKSMEKRIAIMQESEPERGSTFYCDSCKVDGVGVDEDGLCTSCGATPCGRPHREAAPAVTIEPAPDDVMYLSTESYPTYNHTHGDSEATPCPQCALLVAKARDAALEKALRSEIERLKGVDSVSAPASTTEIDLPYIEPPRECPYAESGLACRCLVCPAMPDRGMQFFGETCTHCGNSDGHMSEACRHINCTCGAPRPCRHCGQSEQNHVDGINAARDCTFEAIEPYTSGEG